MSEIQERHCERCESPLEGGDLRCSICAFAVLEPVPVRENVEVELLRCTGCGAAVKYDPNRRGASCDFCDSVYHVESIEDPVEQSEGFLPFTLEKRLAIQAMKTWLGSLGWFRPSDLQSAARLETLKPLWWVGWSFDAEATISWTCDSDAGSRRSSWAPHSGQYEVVFDDIIVSASRGLTDEEVDAIRPGLDSRTVESEPRGAKNATIERFDVQRSQARQAVVRAVEAIAKDQVQAEEAPGSEFRNVHVAALIRKLRTRRYGFPAYVMTYRYRSKLFRAVVSGQDASYVTGIAPISLAKVLLAVLGGVIGFLAIVAIVAAIAGS